ncbi:DUF1428 domain-containing protein [Mangrovimonas sp. YM274]|uniref:DUF1428 domain-containing protein n=1 Tax=Mangrovimonas sp. YM274 TaxID=3070660 RepID=UPI0027DB346F|nr:DUF1428 family protein [Mangrovimonas sp. YM274]WMI67775.1 DUF1428 family protein [Mangrovimonas sp. YM274]
MTNYIDAFVFPIPRVYLNDYKKVAEKVADIWKEYGAIAYFEFIGDELHLEGTKSFIETVNAKKDEIVIFGWTVFPSKEIRDLANQKVPTDPRIKELVEPLTNPEKLIFDASRMVYGGFKPFVESK